MMFLFEWLEADSSQDSGDHHSSAQIRCSFGWVEPGGSRRDILEVPKKVKKEV